MQQKTHPSLSDMSFCPVRYCGSFALSGSYSRAFGIYKLLHHHYPTVNNLCLFILQDRARQSQAVRLTHTLTNMLMWCQTAWLKYFPQAVLTWENLCGNWGLHFSTLDFSPLFKEPTFHIIPRPQLAFRGHVHYWNKTKRKTSALFSLLLFLGKKTNPDMFPIALY